MGRARYFPRVAEKPAFTWAESGPVTPPPSQRKVAHLPHYRSFTLGELTAGVGDHVLVSNDNSDGNLLSYDVAKIESLYENADITEDPHRAVVSWLCRPNLLPAKLRKSHGYEEQGVPPYDSQLDLVVEARNFDTDISAESLYYRCHVIPAPMAAQPREVIKAAASTRQDNYPVYMLRFRMRGGKKSKTSGRSSFTIEANTASATLSPKRTPLAEKRPAVAAEAEIEAMREGAISPDIPLVPKLEIPRTLLDLSTKKRRRLSSHGENCTTTGTPSKRKKKSDSAANSPDLDDFVTGPPGTPTGRVGSLAPGTPTGGVGSLAATDSYGTGLNGGYWGAAESPKRQHKPKSKEFGDNCSSPLAKTPKTPTQPSKTPTRSSKTPTQTSKTDRTPKTKEKTLKTENDNSPRVGTRTPKTASKTPKTPTASKTPKTPTATKTPKTGPKSRKSAATEERFTEVNTATGSGRKVKITCGEKGTDSRKSFAPSAGLASSQISSMLDSDSDSDVEDDVSEKRKPAKTGATRKSAGGAGKRAKQEKQLIKSPVKSDSKIPARKQRRASLACVAEVSADLRKTTPATPQRGRAKKTLATSETKKRGSRQKSTVDSSGDSDFDAELERKLKNKKKGKVAKVETESEGSSSSETDDEEEEDMVPSRRRKVGRGRKATATAAATPRPRTVKTFTPGVAARAQPLSSQLAPLAEAQARLHVSAVPDSLPCREDEFSEVFGYVESKLQEGAGGCIYISGVPGTGKTATVKQVMRYMTENSEDFPEFAFHEINGMRLTSPEQTYVEMWRLLTGEKLVHEQAMKKLDERFSKPAPKRTHTVLLVDELDMLCKRKQTVLYNMFEWPSRPTSKLVIIAIANTMDLPERDMDMRVISRLGLNRLHFEPYTHQQLQCIVKSRLEGLSVFHADEIQLVSRKVAGLSGDARRALDICRMVAEKCEREGRDRVTQMDVASVHQEMFCSPKMMFIRSCSKMEQFFLRALVSDYHKTGVEETTLGSAIVRLCEILSTEGLPHLSLHATVAVAARLSSQRLILSEDYRRGLDTKLRLNVGFEDINFALTQRPEE